MAPIKEGQYTMREELEAAWDLYEGMPPEEQRHWRERSLPSVQFESDAERAEFLAGLDERDKRLDKSAVSQSGCVAWGGPGPPVATQPVLQVGRKVKVDLTGLTVGTVQFSQNCDAVYAIIEAQTAISPPRYRLRLLFSFHGVSEVEVPAERIRPL
jgi:hypothetical protein